MKVFLCHPWRQGTVRKIPLTSNGDNLAMEAIRLRREGVNILGPKPKRNSNVGWKLRLFLEGWVSDANYLNLKSKQVGKKEGKRKRGKWKAGGWWFPTRNSPHLSMKCGPKKFVYEIQLTNRWRVGYTLKFTCVITTLSYVIILLLTLIFIFF